VPGHEQVDGREQEQAADRQAAPAHVTPAEPGVRPDRVDAGGGDSGQGADAVAEGQPLADEGGDDGGGGAQGAQQGHCQADPHDRTQHERHRDGANAPPLVQPQKATSHDGEGYRDPDERAEHEGIQEGWQVEGGDKQGSGEGHRDRRDDAHQPDRAHGAALCRRSGGTGGRRLAGGRLQRAQGHGQHDHERKNSAECAVLVSGEEPSEDGMQDEVADVLQDDGDQQGRGQGTDEGLGAGRGRRCRRYRTRQDEGRLEGVHTVVAEHRRGHGSR
jgi:hypothetical protein